MQSILEYVCFIKIWNAITMTDNVRTVYFRNAKIIIKNIEMF